MEYPFVKQLLSIKKNIVVVTHKTPDGDALGSSLALLHAFKNMHNITVIVPNEYPHYLKWLPASKNVMIYENNELECDPLLEQADVLFCLDFNKLYRTHTMCDVLTNLQAYKILIDHHEDPDDFCDQMLSNPAIASTAEMIYEFLITLDYSLDKHIATCLYTGIITDTGSLKYPNVTQETHNIVSDLMSFEINHSLIHRKLFDNQNISRLDLLKICLNNLIVFDLYNTAVVFLKEQDLLDCNYQKGDTEGFVNLPLSIKDISFSAFFVEFKDGIKISFRSQGEFNVNLFAKTYFDGGGHKNAAGGFINHKNMEQAIQYFSKSLEEFSKIK